MIFSTFFYSHKCPILNNKFYGHPDCSQQDKATFLVMWPSEPCQPSLPHFHPTTLQSSSHTVLLTGPGAEFTDTSLPTHLPLAVVPHALITLVNSNSTIKSTSNVFLQLSLAFSCCLPTPLLCFRFFFLMEWGELRSHGLGLRLCAPRV